MGYVYKITNTVNNKSYIGISIHEPEKDRIQKHLSGHGNRVIANAVKKYGRDAFTYEVLEENVFDEFLPDLEVAYIANFNTVVPNGYNLTHGGDGAGPPSKETRRKISKSLTGKTLPAEHRRKISEGGKGKKRSAETRRKISKARMGITLSEETRRKISESRQGEKNANFGKSPSAETRRKISEAQRGKKHYLFGKMLPIETRRKISEALRGENNPRFGKSHSAETRRKISEAKKGKKGKPHSAETRRKISEAKRHPDYMLAYEYFLSIPSGMSLTEKRKLLFSKFPHVKKANIYGWVSKWKTSD